MVTKSYRYLLAAALTSFAAGTAHAASVVVSTTAGWDGSSAVYNWGQGSVTQTYGQTVTAPSGTAALNGFSFIIQDLNDNAVLGASGPITYQANVYQWDPSGSHPFGAALYQSAVSTTPGTGTGLFIETSFNTGTVPVTPGTQYVLFLTTDGIVGSANGSTAWAYQFTDPYAGGAFWFLNDANAANLTATAWTDSTFFGQAGGNDLIFTATFQVPEPVGAALFGTALLGLGLVKSRRRA